MRSVSKYDRLMDHRPRYFQFAGKAFWFRTIIMVMRAGGMKPKARQLRRFNAMLAEGWLEYVRQTGMYFVTAKACQAFNEAEINAEVEVG